jgi:hypothetical protein
MTTLVRHAEPWVVQPGWGIHVDLTPPEVVSSRHVRVLRNLIVSVLVAVVLICAGGYFFAANQRSTAEDAFAAAQTQNLQLAHQAAKPEYTSVTRVRGALKEVQAQLATLMKGDVELDRVFTVMGSTLPRGATFASVTVNISLTGVTQGVAGASAVGGHARIGDVRLTGSARTVDDVSVLVERLQHVVGLVDVVPNSNTRSVEGVQFDISLGLDDRLLSHRFDLKGGN